MEESFYEKFVIIITDASYNTTYKMAYAKALVDIANEIKIINEDIITISVNQIAEKFKLLRGYKDSQQYAELAVNEGKYRRAISYL